MLKGALLVTLLSSTQSVGNNCFKRTITAVQTSLIFERVCFCDSLFLFPFHTMLFLPLHCYVNH